MSEHPGNRAERYVFGGLSACALVLAAWIAVVRPWLAPFPLPQFDMIQIWVALVGRFKIQPLAGILPWLVIVDAILAAGLALALCVSTVAAPYVRLLRRALTLGALSALYLFALRLRLDPANPAMPVMDVLAFTVAAIASADLCAFLASYPQRPTAERLQAHSRDEAELKPKLGFERLHMQLILGIQRMLKRLGAPERLTRDMASEGAIASQVRFKTRWLDVLAASEFRIVLGLLGAVAGVLFALANGNAIADTLVITAAVLGPYLPLLGVVGLEVNYRFGDAGDRRRIGWIYLGPMTGFGIGSATFFVLFILAIVLSGTNGEPAQFWGLICGRCS